MNKIKKLNWKLLAIILIIPSLGIYFYRREKPKKGNETALEQHSAKKMSLPAEVLKKHPLTFVRLIERGVYEEITLPGTVSYDLENMAKVGSRASGRINDVMVKEGDSVGKGSPLASISSLELGSVEASYLKSKARLEAVKLQADRAQELYEKRITSAKEFEIAMMDFKTVKTEVDTSRIALENFGLSKLEIKDLEVGKYNSQNLILRSPIRGTVTERKAVLGQAVSTKENLFTIANLHRLWIMLDVYEKDLRSIEIGAEATVDTLGVKSETLKARVAHVGEIIDPVKKTAPIRLEVNNTRHKLKPGQTITAKVQGLISESKSHRIMVLPGNAVHRIEGKPVVFIANQDGTFEAREVATGQSIEDDIEIKSGVTSESNIVSEGSFLLKSEYLK
ncbi:MAG: efflux RND transporter periplasmic adaptor subunit [Leptospira sp.]|nr:efflux RND transporter periplasmic adaptor subunit [Leptospira sp.]